MKNTLIKLAALFLVLCMICLSVGCAAGDTSSDVEIIYQYEDESTANGDNTNASKNEGANNQNSGTSNNGTTNSNTTSTGKRPSSKAEAVINDNVNTKDYAGTSITYATWRNPALYEDGPVVKEFENKYNIKVNIDLMTESTYTNTVLGRIAAGKAPDVYFSTYTFPYCKLC